ncbi:helix-turn-helix domain-containing protein [Halomonas eurihalina]|uniref:Helix-turn-helix domain-containing protein n=1 Tax=Halomonas eurihalina TaxID=42566 RepID=A0A5D9DCM7_HALER|nr:helix-turn-helix domain-containing protein [Halomonas eurihalina]
MSLAAMNWARQSMKTLPSDVRAPARLALMLMADYADEDHVCWPSIKTMSEEMGCSTRSVQRAIDALEERGLLAVQKRQAANGRQQSNRYRLAVGAGCQSVTPSTSDQAESVEGGDNLTPSEGDKLSGEGDSPVRGRVTPVSPLESTTVNLNPPPSDARGVFDRAAQQDDQGRPVDNTPTSRQQPMTYDWQPDAGALAMACQRRGMAADTQPDAATLADFVTHFAEQPHQRRTHQGWHERLAKWLSENRQRQPLAPTGGPDHAQRPAAYRSDDRRSEREAVREQLANPGDTSWADGWWPEDDTTERADAGAGEPGVHPAGSDLSEDLGECVPECGHAESGSSGAGAGTDPLVGTADAAGGRAGDERTEASGEYLAADDPGAGLDAGAYPGGLRYAGDW